MVSEIHQYPSRPEDFVEPLFRTPESAAEILEHFLMSPWLARASELVRSSGRAPGGAGHAFGEDRREAVELRWRPDGKVELFQGCGPGRGLARPGKSRRGRSRKLVLYVVERWREVRDWWHDGGGTDLYVYRFALSDGSVVDVARSSARRGSWTLVGVVD